MNSSSMALPNPYTPMAFLSPQQAEEFQVATYVYMATMGALTWDWLMAIPAEYTILSRGSIFSVSKVVYLCARIFSLGFCVASAMFQVADVHNCQTLMHCISALSILAMSCNNVLFLIRVCAVYGNSRTVTAVFLIPFFAVLGTSLATPFGLVAGHLGPTSKCVELTFKPWIASVPLCNAVNSTLVFLAISYRIASQAMHTRGQSWRSALRCFFIGDGAPRVGRDLLRSGQLCYLATISLNIAQTTLALLPHSGYKAMLNIPGLALENSMTARVHRAVLLGLISSFESNHRAASASASGRTRTAPALFLTTVDGTATSEGEYALDVKRAEMEMDLGDERV